MTLRSLDNGIVTTASPALYLARDDERNLPASLVMAIYDYVEHGRYALKMGGQNYDLRLADLLEQQEDWVRVAVNISQT